MTWVRVTRDGVKKGGYKVNKGGHEVNKGRTYDEIDDGHKTFMGIVVGFGHC